MAGPYIGFAPPPSQFFPAGVPARQPVIDPMRGLAAPGRLSMKRERGPEAYPARNMRTNTAASVDERGQITEGRVYLTTLGGTPLNVSFNHHVERRPGEPAHVTTKSMEGLRVHHGEFVFFDNHPKYTRAHDFGLAVPVLPVGAVNYLLRVDSDLAPMTETGRMDKILERFAPAGVAQSPDPPNASVSAIQKFQVSTGTGRCVSWCSR
jgi:hypothetical protein